MGYVYCITNNINGKKYIGKTEYADVNKRLKQHFGEYKKERCKNRPLYRAINKYGKENFCLSVLSENLSGDELCKKEIELIYKFNTIKKGYNGTLGGDGKSYLGLNAQEVIDKYGELKNVRRVSMFFKCDRGTIKNLLDANSIKILGCKSEKSGIFVPNKVKNVSKGLTFDTITEAVNYMIIKELTISKRFHTVRQGIYRAINGRRSNYLGDIWIKVKIV
jgi:hypothetical protein